MTDDSTRPRSRAGMPPNDARLRPDKRLFHQALATMLAFAVPAFGVFYFLTIPTGAWLPVAIVQAVVSLGFLVAVAAFFRVGIWADASGVVERGFFGRVTRTPIAEIGSTVLIQAYYGGGADTVPQFFVCDHDGKQRVRLRGQFWAAEDMAVVRDALGVPSSELAESVSTRDILTRYPGLLYWFERRPILALAGASAVLLFGGALVYWGISMLASAPPLAA